MKITKLAAAALASIVIAGCANASRRTDKMSAPSQVTTVMSSFKDIEDVEYMEVGGPMLGFAKLALSATPVKGITSHLKRVHVLEYDDAESGIRTEITNQLKNSLSSYELLMSAHDDEDSVEIYALLGEDDTISELVLYTGSENAVIAVTGEISQEDIAKVIEESQQMSR